MQTIVFLFTAEAELIAAIEAANEALNLKQLCNLGFVHANIVVNCDGQSAIHPAENLALSSRQST